MLALPFRSWHDTWFQILDNWSDDAYNFLRHDAPKIFGVILIALILLRIFALISKRLERFSHHTDFPTGFRAQQMRTLSGVVHGVGMFFVIFLASMQVLQILGINMGPLLASAGVAGLAIGFGAQTLVKDVINGFFILVENQFEVGDQIRVGGVQGVVELMTLRRTILRDVDGTIHTIPNGTMVVVSNMTRDWTQVTLHVSVDYKEDSDKVIKVLHEVATELREDQQFADSVVADPVVHGIDRVHGSEVEYLVTVKTRPGQQFLVQREMRRRVKQCMERNNIQPGGQSRYFVVDRAPDAK